MNRQNIVQALSLGSMVSKGNAYTRASLYMTLLKLSRRLSTIDVHSCNGTKYKDEESITRARQDVYVKLDEALSPHGISYYHQADPRGTSLFVSKDYKLDEISYTNGLAIY
jgi:hypothetical protein